LPRLDATDRDAISATQDERDYWKNIADNLSNQGRENSDQWRYAKDRLKQIEDNLGQVPATDKARRRCPELIKNGQLDQDMARRYFYAILRQSKNLDQYTVSNVAAQLKTTGDSAKAISALASRYQVEACATTVGTASLLARDPKCDLIKFQGYLNDTRDSLTGDYSDPFMRCESPTGPRAVLTRFEKAYRPLAEACGLRESTINKNPDLLASRIDRDGRFRMHQMMMVFSKTESPIKQSFDPKSLVADAELLPVFAKITKRTDNDWEKLLVSSLVRPPLPNSSFQISRDATGTQNICTQLKAPYKYLSFMTALTRTVQEKSDSGWTAPGH
jgi:polyhydroxyalkanoate synthesis regulator phasin